MRIDRFQMERTQCLYENEVDFNLSESGVQPLTARELLTSDAGREAFLDAGLKYSQSNGTPELREHIASFYPGATASNVLVTTGTSEANFSTLWGLLDKTGRAAIMIPNYLQAWGLARAYAARADAYRLVEREENGVQRWALDIESLRKAVTKRTKLILVTNPNNPTGAVLTAAEMDEIIRLARQVGAWIVADEVYRGAEVASDRPTPTFWGRYSKVIVTAGLSKAFGMPGVRVGWIVGPEKTVAHLWSYQDYTTLTPSVLSDRLARIAMEPVRRGADPRAYAVDSPHQSPAARALDSYPRRHLQLHPAARWCDRAREVPAADSVGAAFRAAARRVFGAHHAGRPFRHREVHPHWVRLRHQEDVGRPCARRRLPE